MSSNPEVPEEAPSPIVTPNPADEGLPQDIPLTPEDVQDEAIRGDFVIRWAVVLLALLMGFALIDQTMTLVHLRSGQYLAEHGFLPPRGGDPFSATADTRTWFNLSWLFDLLVAGAYGAGSWIGVSVLKGLLAGATFWQLLRISRPGLPTWWGSICAIPALLACQPRFTALPEIMTLLGLALSLRLLHEWKRGGNPRSLWLLVPLFFLWSNLDGRVFVGVWLLALFLVGELLTRVPEETRRPLGPMLTALGCAIGATFLHPFPGRWILEPWVLYGQVYPAFQVYNTTGAGAGIQFYPVASPEFFKNPNLSGVCGIALLVTAALTLFLNRKRLELTHLLWFFGFAVLTVLSTHELAAAALVFCVIATLNGQSWYEHRFSLEYTTDSRFLLLSRGGRAVTVLLLFAIAFFTTAGRIKAPGGVRLGFGLSPELAGHVASYEALLAKSFGDRGFVFNPAQGDLLIWCGKKPFIDQRLELYAGKGSEDLVESHLKTRETFRVSERTTRAVRAQGVETLKGRKITFAVPRLTGINPDYQTMAALLSDPNWRMQRLGASTAVFYLFDEENKELVDFLLETQQIFTEEAFRKEAGEAPLRVSWPTEPSVYEKYLWGKSEELSPESLEGQHLMRLSMSIGTPNPAMAYLAIRRVQQAIARNPNDVLANIVLGEAYTYLGRFDVMNLPQGAGSLIEQMRYMQAVAAYQHALIADPDQLEVRLALYGLYQRAGKLDLALRELETFSVGMKQRQSLFGPVDPEQEKQTDEQIRQMRETVEKISQECEKGVEKAPETQKNAARMVFYYQRGLILKALEQFATIDPGLLANPEISRMHALCLLEAGRTEEAYQVSGQLAVSGQPGQGGDWRGVRTLCLLTNGEYEEAIRLWEEVSLETTRGGFANLLVNLSPKHSPNVPTNWPLNELQAAVNYFYSFTDQVSALKLNAALAQLEVGQIKDAGETLQEILDQNPESLERGTIAYYLTMIRQTPVDPLPPSERIPVLFAPEPGDKPAK